MPLADTTVPDVVLYPVGVTPATVMVSPFVRVTVGGAVRVRVAVLPFSLAPVMAVSPAVPPPELARPEVSVYRKEVVVGTDVMVKSPL